MLQERHPELFDANTNVLLIALKWTLAVALSLWTSLDSSAQTLLVLMLADFVTGLISGWVKKEVTSEKSFQGLARKGLVLILVSVLHSSARIMGMGIDLGSVVAIAFCFNEMISITENCARCGVPIPKVLVDSLAKLKSNNDSPPTINKL